MNAQPSDLTAASDIDSGPPVEEGDLNLEWRGIDLIGIALEEAREAEGEVSMHPNFSKAEVDALLTSIRVPADVALDVALERFADLRTVHERLNSEFGEDCGMVELDGAQLPDSVPPELQHFPAWYIRLPAEWARRVEGMRRAQYLTSYIAQHPNAPWYIAQWLALESGETDNTGSWLEPHVRVSEDDVMSSVVRSGAGAVIIFLECNERLTWAGFPIDEGLLGSLQAGGVASSRHPLFDFTIAHLQAQVRALNEGVAEAEPESVFTLQAVRLEGSSPSRYDWEENYLAESKQVSRCAYSDGALGLLKTVTNFVPQDLSDDRRIWMKLTVPGRLWNDLADGLATVELAKLPAVDSHKSVARVTVTAGSTMFEAHVDTQEACLGSLLDAYASQDGCPIAFEARESGYLHVVEVEWPADCGADDFQAVKPECDDIVPQWHEDTEERARALVETLGRGVKLYVCSIVDARTWQEQDWRTSVHSHGPRGGLAAIPSVVRRHGSND